VPVDSAAVKAAGLVHEGDTLLSELKIEIPNRSYLLKNDLAIYAVIAANHWKRPICFTSTQELGDLGLAKYVRLRGLSYQLVPFDKGGVDNDAAYDVIMNKFAYGSANIPGVYYDEENRRHLLTLRSAYGEIAGNLADEGRKDDAKKILNKFESMASQENFPYAMAGRYNQHNQTTLVYLEGAYKAGYTELADKVAKAVRKDLEQQKKYYDYLKADREALYNSVALEDQVNNILLTTLDLVERKYGKTANTEKKENEGTIINTIPGNKKDSGQKKDSNKK